MTQIIEFLVIYFFRLTDYFAGMSSWIKRKYN